MGQLTAAVARKTAALRDTEDRLTNRLRWGIALMQAKSEANIKRKVMGEWR